MAKGTDEWIRWASGLAILTLISTLALLYKKLDTVEDRVSRVEGFLKATNSKFAATALPEQFKQLAVKYGDALAEQMARAKIDPLADTSTSAIADWTIESYGRKNPDFSREYTAAIRSFEAANPGKAAAAEIQFRYYLGLALIDAKRKR